MTISCLFPGSSAGNGLAGFFAAFCISASFARTVAIAPAMTAVIGTRASFPAFAAVVIHTDDLPKSDQTPRSGGRYLMTETWQRIKGAWKLRIVHVDAVRTDPPAMTLDPGELDQLTGAYRSGGSWRSLTILRRLT